MRSTFSPSTKIVSPFADVEPVEPRILADTSYNLPSRLAWLMTTSSSLSGLFYVTRDNTMERLSASSRQLDRALRMVTKTWKLFRWDGEKKCYVRVLVKRTRARVTESSEAFKLRVQRTVNVKVGVAWVLRDLLEERRSDGGILPRPGLVAPHGLSEFAEQLECSPRAVSLALGQILDGDHFTRHDRKNNKPVYNLRDIESFVEMSFGPHYRRYQRAPVD